MYKFVAAKQHVVTLHAVTVGPAGSRHLLALASRVVALIQIHECPAPKKDIAPRVRVRVSAAPSS